MVALFLIHAVYTYIKMYKKENVRNQVIVKVKSISCEVQFKDGRNKLAYDIRNVVLKKNSNLNTVCGRS